ncbi:MAG: protein kinase domain-containing protein [Acidimicrobiales bacterium]
MSRANLDHAAARTLGDRYQLVSRIGSGASAEVYQATDLRLGRSVAVKQLRSDLSEDARFAKLFRSEAHLAAQLSHPNILTVFDWSADLDGQDGGAYIVTELLSGGSLRTILDNEGTVSLSQAALIGLQTAKGLAVAHDQGLVHRDIKPANLLFGGDGRIHIGDFGIARAVAQSAWTEPEGVLIGTARYAAPEQAAAETVDGLVDVYSLTVCLIEALTGEVPLVRENALGTMVLRQAEDLPVDDSFGPLADALAWAGAADPERRASAVEFAAALADACRLLPKPEPLTLIDLTEHVGGPVAVRPNVSMVDSGDLQFDDEQEPAAAILDQSDLTLETPEQQSRPPRRRGRRLLGLVLFLVLGVAALFGGRLLAESRQPDVVTVQVGLPSYVVEDFTSMRVADVEAAVEPNRWTVVVTEQYLDGTEPGQILGQFPEPGVSMGLASQVELVVSLGPVPRSVPETVGQQLQAASAQVEAANLVVGSVNERFDESIEAGIVLEASIDGVPAQPGTEFLTGTVIDFVVSAGPAPREVPPLVGLTAEQARVALADRDLAMASTEEYSNTAAEGTVIAVNPNAGSMVSRGSTITIRVSLGLPFVNVPDVTGMLVSEAIEVLRGQGFQVKINGTIGAAVLGTRPTAAESVRSGTEIEIISTEADG